MNDDQIRSELERRAGSSPTKPDWAKRVLLPAVWHEIDARPQPVVTSRLPSLAGAAALVVALLVLVVAVPRLNPRPPAASPSGLEVLSTQSFASGVQSGALNGQTVLVAGAIVAYDGPAFFGGACGPNGPACLLGQIAGVEPRLLVFGPDVAMANADESSVELSNGWPFWQRVEPPLAGTLMLSVDGQSVEYIGRTVPNGDRLTWSPGQVKTQLLTSARDLDEVVLVNGYLTGLDAVASCAIPPSPIPGLPRRDECGRASWLADEPVAIDPLEQVIPPSAVQVQASAFAEYAPDPSARLGLALAPQRAVYGVTPRLYGNGCIDSTRPCWDWSVIGRLSQPAPDVAPPSIAPVVTPEIAPSPVSGPTYMCTGPDWEGGAIELTDHLGVIEACVATRGDGPEDGALVSEISRGVVGVSWQDPCPGGGASIDLWPREDAPDRPRYVFAIDSRQLDAPRGCRAAMAGITVEVTFINSELAPENLVSDVEAHLTTSGAASDATQITGGEFRLALSARATQYSTDEPIEIQAQLLYEGDQATIDLSGTFSLVNGFGIEQLDGDLEMGPGWDLPCVQHQLRAGEPLVVRYEKSAGWSPDDPNAEFLRDWVNDSELHLPVGTWLVTAYSDFLAGGGCSGERVQMQASIVITVDGPDVEPTPAASSPAVGPRQIPCDPLSPLFVDESGLVESCTATQAGAQAELPLAVRNPDGDQTVVEITWAGGYSDFDRLVLRRGGAGYELVAHHANPINVIRDASVSETQLRLQLSAPVSSDSVSVIFEWPTSGPRPSEPKATSTTAVDCSPTFLLLDETGLVEVCSTWTPEPGQSGVSQGPDASSVFVAWTYSYCRGAPFVRFELDGGRYVFDLGHFVTLPMVWPSCEPVTRTVGIAVRFKQPLDAGLIDVATRP